MHCKFHTRSHGLDVWLKTHAQKGAFVTAVCTALGELPLWLDLVETQLCDLYRVPCFCMVAELFG